MKKIIISIIALACGLCAYAKTLEELVSGIPAYTDSVKFGGAPRYAYVTENYADFEREFASYLRSGIAEKDFRDLSDAELAVRKAMAPFYTKYGDKFDVSDAAGIRLSVPAFYKWTGDAKYNAIKLANWQIDGKKLPPITIWQYASAAKDMDYMLSITINEAISSGVLIPWAKTKAKSLYYADDVKAAYEEALDIEAALRSRGGNHADAITSLKAVVEVEDFLYLKFTRATKIK